MAPSFSRRESWDKIYRSKTETELSWFEEEPSLSLSLIKAVATGAGDAIIDIGGGASRLADRLLAEGYSDVTVLDVSEKALKISKRRLAGRAGDVRWIVADVTDWEPQRSYRVWHDRAAFHFLTSAEDRAAYAESLAKALAPGGFAIVGAFAPDGPEMCSGFPVVRYGARELGQALGPDLALVETQAHNHRTPKGALQKFRFSVFKRR